MMRRRYFLEHNLLILQCAPCIWLYAYVLFVSKFSMEKIMSLCRVLSV